MWESVEWLEVWLITRWASLTPPHCLLTVSQRCSLHLWGKNKTKKKPKCVLRSCTQQSIKNSSHFADTVLTEVRETAKPPHIWIQIAFVLTGASDYWRAQQHLYVKEHILSIMVDNHRLQGGLHTVHTDSTGQQGWKAQTWHTNTNNTSLIFTSKQHKQPFSDYKPQINGASFPCVSLFQRRSNPVTAVLPWCSLTLYIRNTHPLNLTLKSINWLSNLNHMTHESFGHWQRRFF